MKKNQWEDVNDETVIVAVGEQVTCQEISLESELVHCGICKGKFHTVCSTATADDKWATKSMITTKKNFMFLCNCCLTTLENNMADIDGHRMRKMESNMDVINKELSEIKKLVSTITDTTTSTSASTTPDTDQISKYPQTD